MTGRFIVLQVIDPKNPSLFSEIENSKYLKTPEQISGFGPLRGGFNINAPVVTIQISFQQELEILRE